MADLKSRLAAARAAADAAKAAISDDDRAEIALRADLAKLDAEREAAESQRRELDLARRLDAARDAHPDALLEKLAIKGRSDTFIIKHDSRAHAAWQKALAASATSKKSGDVDDAQRAYAAALVIDWNGLTNFESGDNGFRLHEFLTENVGMVTPIVNAGAELAGFFAEERKS